MKFSNEKTNKITKDINFEKNYDINENEEEDYNVEKLKRLFKILLELYHINISSSSERFIDKNFLCDLIFMKYSLS